MPPTTLPRRRPVVGPTARTRLLAVALVLVGLVAPSATPLRSVSAAESDLAWVSISPLPAARLAEAVTIPLDVTGGAAPYNISVVSGALPGGLALTGTSITGTPTSTGTSSFTLRATDAIGGTVDRAFELSVVRGVRQVVLESPTNTHIVLGTLASRTRASSTGTSASEVPSPLTKGWVTISGAAAPFTVTGVDSRSDQPYTFQTDVNYSSGTAAWRKEGDERALSGSWTFASSTVTHTDSRGVAVASALRLNSSGSCVATNTTWTSYCSVFGPEVWSASFVADAGESLSFRWAASGGGDDYETYGFLVNTANNEHTVLAYGRGGQQPWTVASGSVPADGTYRFRFVNGSYDRTGGYVLGANMFIDPSISVGSTQTITFPALGEQSTATASPNVLNLNGIVTASSGLPVTLSSSTTGVCTVSGMSVTLVGGGTCTLSANQSGSDLFVPASTVTGSFVVVVKQAQAAVTMTLSTSSAVYGDTVSVTPGGGSGTGAYLVSLSSSASCSLSGTTVTVTAGTGDCAVVVTRASDATFAERSSTPQVISVAPRPVTTTGSAVTDRTYDGTTTVAVTAGTLTGALAGDAVALSAPATGTAASAAVGTHAVSASFALTGPSAPNYSLTAPTLLVTISARPVTLGVTRPYDASTTIDPAVEGGSFDLDGVVAGESLSLTGTASVASPDASPVARPLTLGTLALADAASGPGAAANYVFAGAGHTVTITPRRLTLSGSRIYDGSAAIDASELAPAGLVPGETVGLTGSAIASSADVSLVPADTVIVIEGAEAGLPDFDQLRVVLTTQAGGRLWLTSSSGLSTITGFSVIPTSQGAATTSIGFRGPRASVIAALRDDLRFISSASGEFTVTVEGSAADLTAFASADGARYYRVISDSFANWQAARTAAAAETITLKDGTSASGYLATITSAEENEFIRRYVSSTSWIGASDDVAVVNAALGSTVYANQAAVEGRWYWVTGPESGTRFSVGNTSPVAVEGRYNAWAGGEPNNSGSEHCGEFYTTGRWNDIPCGSANKPAIVEFGPFPATQDVTTSTVVTVSGGPRTLVDRSALALVDGAGGLASNYTLDGAAHGFTFLPRPVRGTFAAADRVFDGTLAAEVVVGSRALRTSADSPAQSGVVVGDVGSVSLSGGVASFTAAGIGLRAVTLTGATLSGARAFNYTLDGVDATTARIAGRPLSIAPSGTFEVHAGSGRVYDGTTTATITDSALELVGVIAGESVSLVPAAEFVTATVGIGKEVRISAASTLTGPDAANYALDLTGAPTTTATIRPRPVIVVGASAVTRPYDGTTAVVIGGATLSNTVPGDGVSLQNATAGIAASRDAGTQGVATSMALTGAAATNYVLLGQPSLSVVITPLPVSITMNALPSRPYDGATALPLGPSAFTVSGVLAGESITVAGTAQRTSRAAGTRGVTLTGPTYAPGPGTSLANYLLPSSVTGSVTVTPLPLRLVGATVASRAFDGTTAATVSGATLDGVRPGDSVSLGGATAGTFASAQPGTHAVAYRPTLVGADAPNYSLSVPPLSGTIATAPAVLRVTGGLVQFESGDARLVRASVVPESAGRVVVSYPGGTAPSAPGTYAVRVTLESSTHRAEPLALTLTIEPVESLLAPLAGGVVGTPGGTSGGQSAAPVTDEVAREQLLARIAVRSDGTLALPEIGPVLETDGSTPALAPSDYRILEDGEPSAARLVVVDEQLVRVESADGSVSLELQAAATGDGRSPLPVDADGTLLLDRGGFLEVAGSGFLEGSTAEVWMFSTATFLGTAVVGADGTFAGSFRIDEVVTSGEHTIQLNGVGVDQRVRSTSLGVRVSDDSDPSRARIVLATSDGTGALARFGPAWMLLLAAVLGAGVTAWSFARRRRDDGIDVAATSSRRSGSVRTSS